MRKLSLLGAVAAAALATTNASAAELVTNGGFEAGTSGWSFVDSSGFTFVNNAEAHSGLNAAWMGAVNTIGTVSQTLSTVAGQTYNYSFWLKSEAGNPQSFTLDVGGTTFNVPTVFSPFPYTNFTGSFVASSNATLLKFSARQDPSFFYLDDVSVTGLSSAVPEPATWGMMILGFGLMGSSLRIRRRAAKAVIA